MKAVSIPSKIIRTHKDGTVDTYHVRRAIGKGGFAIVYEVSRSKTDQKFAIKAIPLSNLKDNERIKRQLEEINIQTSLNHPNILRSYDYFKDNQNLYMVLELCPYNTVHKLLKDKGKFSEFDAADIIYQVLEGVKYLHQNSIIHRDIKLQNLLIGSDGKIKISDFGISIKLSSQVERCYSTCGTYGFMPPEMLVEDNDGYSFESDIWSIGVCTFLLLTGQSPFVSKDKNKTEKMIRNGKYRIPSHSHLSLVAKDFIRSILQTNPENRPSLDDLLHHPFIENPQKIPHINFFQNLKEEYDKDQKISEQQQQQQQQQPQPNEQKNQQQPIEQKNQQQENQQNPEQPQQPPPQPPQLQQNQFAQSYKPKKPKLYKPSPQKQDHHLKQLLLSPESQKKIDQKQKQPKPLEQLHPPEQFAKSYRRKNIKQYELTPKKSEQPKDQEQNQKLSEKQQKIDQQKKLEEDEKNQIEINNNEQQKEIEKENHNMKQEENIPENQQKEEKQKPKEQNQNKEEKQTPKKQKERNPSPKHQQQKEEKPKTIEEPKPKDDNQQKIEQQQEQKEEEQHKLQQKDDKQQKDQQHKQHQKDENQQRIEQQQEQKEQQQKDDNQQKDQQHKQHQKDDNQILPTIQNEIKQIEQVEHQNEQNILEKSHKKKPLDQPQQNQDPFAQSYKPSNLKKRKKSESPQPQDKSQPDLQQQIETIKRKKHRHSSKRKSPDRQESPKSKDTIKITEKNDENEITSINDLSIPSYCVIRFCNKSKRGDLYYFMKNGQVGMISHDHQRLVLDPFGEFIQMWPNNDTNIPKILSPTESDKNVTKLMKYEKAFKESNKHLLQLPSTKLQKDVPMRHVKYWMDSDAGLMFRMDNRVIQVNFQDKSKLILFWEQKALIFAQSLFEDGTIMTFLNLKKSNNSELKQKYSTTKKMVDAMNKGAW